MLPQIQINGHNVEITDILRTFIEDKFSHNLTKYVERITSIHVMLDVNKKRARQIAKVKMHLPNSEIYAEAESEDMYKTIDMLIGKIARQLRKRRSKR